MVRNPGIIKKANFGQLRPSRFNPSTGKKLTDEEFNALKARCKANGAKYTAWKNSIVKGINMTILKRYFGPSLTGKDKTLFLQLSAIDSDETPAKIRGHFMKKLLRWWDLNRREVIETILNYCSKGEAETIKLLNAYNDRGNLGWGSIPAPVM